MKITDSYLHKCKSVTCKNSVKGLVFGQFVYSGDDNVWMCVFKYLPLFLTGIER